MSKIIDIHTHYFPDMGANVSKLLEACKEPYWQNLLTDKNGKRTLQDFPSQLEFIEAMDNAEVKRCVINGAYWQNTTTCNIMNEKCLQFAKAYPDRISALAAICPSDFLGSKRIIENAKKMGFCGIGELCDKVQNFSYADKDFLKLMELCQEENLPVCLHMADNMGKAYSGKIYTDNLNALKLAEFFPNNNFIFAHLAGGEILRKKINLENAFFDSAAFPLLYKEDMWKKAYSNACKNLVFGSDYSLRIYPKKIFKAEFKTLIDEAKNNLPKSFYDDFFYINALRIFRNQNW